MPQADADAGRAQTLKQVLALLEGLIETPAGTVIYDQIERVLDEQQGVLAKLDQVYALLVQLLLDAYAKEPTADNVTRINAKLIQLRRARTGAAVTQAHPEPAAAPPSVGGPSPSRRPVPGAPSSPPPPPPPAPAAAEPPRSEGALPAVERRVNTSYRMHLDRQRDEIEKLQWALAKNVSDAVTQNREFGALLQIELRALQQAQGAELENLRQILVGGVEELMVGQRQLHAKLQRSADYLKIMRGDSERLHEELSRVRLLSMTDEFTGLPNRRAFMRRLQDEIGRASRYGTPLVLGLLDLDEFKNVNDVYGHAAGDEVLRCYATEVLSVLRHHDMVARYGGEEFAVLLPSTTREGATRALEKARQRVGQIRCEHEQRPLPVPTFSAGLVTYRPGETATSVIDRADKALYRAKNLGRNRIEVDSDTLPADVNQHDRHRSP